MRCIFLFWRSVSILSLLYFLIYFMSILFLISSIFHCYRIFFSYLLLFTKIICHPLPHPPRKVSREQPGMPVPTSSSKLCTCRTGGQLYRRNPSTGDGDVNWKYNVMQIWLQFVVESICIMRSASRGWSESLWWASVSCEKLETRVRDAYWRTDALLVTTVFRRVLP